MQFDLRFDDCKQPFFMFDATFDALPEGLQGEELEAAIADRGGFSYFPHLEQSQFLRVYVDEEPEETQQGEHAEQAEPRSLQLHDCCRDAQDQEKCA